MNSQHCGLRAEKRLTLAPRVVGMCPLGRQSDCFHFDASAKCEKAEWRCDISVGDTEAPQLLGEHRGLPDKNANLLISFYSSRDTYAAGTNTSHHSVFSLG